MVALGSVRADAIGDATPVLKSLAARGVTFSAVTSSDSTRRSLFSLLSGYDMHAYTDVVNRAGLSIVAEVERVGYRTFAVVANPHLQPAFLPQIQVLDDYVNLSAVWHSASSSERAAHEQEFRERAAAYDIEPSDFDRAMLFASADRVLKRFEPMLDAREPFFGLVNFEDARDPYLPDPSRYDRSSETATVPALRHRPIPVEIAHPETIQEPERRALVEDTLSRAMARPWATTLDLTSDQVAVYRRRYMAEVREVDAAVGRLMEMLERRGLTESTIVVLVTTNGEEFGETHLLTHNFDGRGDRAATMDAFMTFLLPPSYGVKPHVVSTPAALADVVPTLYDFLGIRFRIPMQLAPYAHGSSRIDAIGVSPRRNRGIVAAPPADSLDDSHIAIRKVSDVAKLRRNLLKFIWNRDTLPDARPCIKRNVPSPIADLQDYARIDEYRVTVDGRDISRGYHFVPSLPNGKLVVMHAGHGCRPLDDGVHLDTEGLGMARTIATLLREGYGVAALYMPRQRPDDCSAGPDPHPELFDATIPQGMRYFLEPVAAMVNELTTGDNPYQRVHMIGLSGGGWTTVVYSALDPRIRGSVSVAGSLPLYLRTRWSWGDMEQNVPEFYDIAGYLDLYILDAADPGRSHLQVLIEKDTCCFRASEYPDPRIFEPAVREYELRVRSTLEAIGGGTFGVQIDRQTPQHSISRSMLETFILPALRRADKAPYQNLQAWDQPAIRKIDPATCVAVNPTRYDHNGDGKADIFWRNVSTGTNWMYVMDGATQTQSAQTNTAPTDWQPVGIGDFDGDGRADVYWRNSATYENSIYRMNVAIVGGGFTHSAPAEWNVAGTGDLNGDGRHDVVWRNSITGQNYVYFMNGTALSGSGEINTVADQNWTIAGIGDFNDDGKDDLLWRNLSTGQNRLYLMNGNVMTESLPVVAVPDLAWQIVGVADFNDDGKADILWRNTSTGANRMYLMNSNQLTSSVPVNTVADQAWQVANTADYNGDGYADILWRNSATGENRMYLMNGNTIISNLLVNQVTDQNWHVIR